MGAEEEEEEESSHPKPNKDNHKTRYTRTQAPATR